MTAQAFEAHRDHLRAVAYRMLGSLAEVDDAVQETWLKYRGADVSGVRNLGGWLTTVLSRVCLDMLRSRAARREQPMDDTFVPDPVVRPLSVVDPEQEVLQADSVGLALLVVLENLEPAERLAFVLHDMFAVPFDEIAPIVERSTDATRQLASRARRRVRGATPPVDADLGRQRKVLDAFLAAARGGDLAALVSLLHPEVVLRADSGPLVGGAAASKVVRGAGPVAEQALTFRQFAPYGRLVLLGDMVGVASVVDGQVLSLMGVTVAEGRITGMYILADPERLHRLDLSALAEQ
ncbi:sigma-70 family RNA polymerase sigma factor [Streptomyces sp. enrichment culture]|uniref:sigma-70 family RNA polymerase sigma factor n=1 Tax=Streptomyces sp. enrichment culture TaxID=1795815 RepID=UPI003F57EF98